jgi:hypothetical protein
MIMLTMSWPVKANGRFPASYPAWSAPGFFPLAAFPAGTGCENLLQENGPGLQPGCTGAGNRLTALHGVRMKALLCPAPAVIEDLDSIPSPYTDEMLSALDDRIVYFESSRGCPFSCSYCLSSVSGGVRYFSLERVFRDLDRLAFLGSEAGKIRGQDFQCGKVKGEGYNPAYTQAKANQAPGAVFILKSGQTCLMKKC